MPNAASSRPRDPDASLLVLLLRFGGIVLVLAWPTLLLPTSVQASWHEALGLGAFPAAPLTDYLTRSIAVLYGIRGLVYFALARDVHRFLPIIRLFGILDVVGGLVILAIDLHAGLPLWWTLAEGPGVVVVGVLLWWLASRVAAAEGDPA